jgi:hypothetical protein
MTDASLFNFQNIVLLLFLRLFAAIYVLVSSTFRSAVGLFLLPA